MALLHGKDTEARLELENLYKRLQRRNKSASYLKVELHMHTPASRACYKFANPSNSQEQEYIALLEAMASSNINLFAITDHNTFAGFFNIQEILKQNLPLSEKLSEKVILPGIEITCYGKHFLAIFSEVIKKADLDRLLLECGVSPSEQGLPTASADLVSPLLLCEKVGAYGGIVLIAHCDEDNGLLQAYFKEKIDPEDIQGASIIKILKTKSVLGLCYNSHHNLAQLHELMSSWRTKHLAIIQASDSHSSSNLVSAPGLPLGSRCSWVKLGKPTFRGLQLALINHRYSVRNDAPPEPTSLHLLGICIQGGFLRDKDKDLSWAVIPFSSAMNCIIGARGTGKTTLMSIVQFLLNRDDVELREQVVNRPDCFQTSIVFLKSGTHVFATRMIPVSTSRLQISHYELLKDRFIRLKTSRKVNALSNSTSSSFDPFIASTNIQSYTQKKILDLGRKEDGVTEVIDFLTALYKPKEFREAMKRFIQLKRDIAVEAEKILNLREHPATYRLTTAAFEQNFQHYILVNRELDDLRASTIKHLNHLMKGILRIGSRRFFASEEIIEPLLEGWIRRERYSSNSPYEHQRDMRRFMRNLCKNPSSSWALPYWFFTGKANMISKEFSIPEEIAKDITEKLKDKIVPSDVVLLAKMHVDFELNVNYRISQKKTYRPRQQLSYGQKAVGMLLLILHGATQLGEARPLFIDQPEDDLDNSYIYHILVKEFLSIKEKRQLIFATHNPNIPIAGQAENILVMQSDGENGWVEACGCFEQPEVAEHAIRVLEGDFEAFHRRAAQYGFTLVKAPGTLT